jgi:hypothetical protein
MNRRRTANASRATKRGPTMVSELTSNCGHRGKERAMRVGLSRPEFSQGGERSWSFISRIRPLWSEARAAG